jgi:hypothetical protein
METLQDRRQDCTVRQELIILKINEIVETINNIEEHLLDHYEPIPAEGQIERVEKSYFPAMTLRDKETTTIYPNKISFIQTLFPQNALIICQNNGKEKLLEYEISSVLIKDIDVLSKLLKDNKE